MCFTILLLDEKTFCAWTLCSVVSVCVWYSWITMPRRCAFGCEPISAPVHHFPNYEKFPERFKEWVALCGGQLNDASDYEHYQKKIVCNRHFTDKDHNRFKRLNALAVPSLYLSGTLVHGAVTETSNEPHQTSELHSCLSEIPAPATTAVMDHELTLASQVSTTSLKVNVLNEHYYTSARTSKYLHTTKDLARRPKFLPPFGGVRGARPRRADAVEVVDVFIRVPMTLSGSDASLLGVSSSDEEDTAMMDVLAPRRV